MAVCLIALPDSVFQIMYNAMPIIIYSAVQTGANNQLGGLKDGLFAIEYHPLTPDTVKKPAIAPTSNGTAIEINNFIL